MPAPGAPAAAPVRCFKTKAFSWRGLHRLGRRQGHSACPVEPDQFLSLLFAPWQPGHGHLLLLVSHNPSMLRGHNFVSFEDCGLPAPAVVCEHELLHSFELHSDNVASGLVFLAVVNTRVPRVLLFSMRCTTLVLERELCPALRSYSSVHLLAFSPDGLHLALTGMTRDQGAEESEQEDSDGPLRGREPMPTLAAGLVPTGMLASGHCERPLWRLCVQGASPLSAALPILAKSLPPGLSGQANS